MPVLTPERGYQVAAGWRRGEDAVELANPAGPLFVGGYAESEITLTGGGGGPTASATCRSEVVIIEPLCPPCC